ncbi:hypothetical protein GYMLUDRAFT_258496 [Collybiopsis luxurians FD-317 M1]|nr:hypothetical protein GYMLUDRAFT_258496 [Collybiopsis luxurians FD-317 M1]
MTMLLPDELLLSIVEYLAFLPKLPDSGSFQFKRVSPELLSLSVVNRRLRRICLPFLFATIHIKKAEDVKKLKNYCSTSSLFLELIRVLDLTRFYSRTEERLNIICQALPQLRRLSHVYLVSFEPSTTLFKAIVEHPSVLTVSTESLCGIPFECLQSDLSKIVLKQIQLDLSCHSYLELYPNQGLRIEQLELYNPHLLDKKFGLRTFRGLQELTLRLPGYPVSFSWLPAFTAAHPQLHKLRLVDHRRRYFMRHTPTFMGSFIDESHRHGLTHNFLIKEVGLNSSTERPSREWCVTSLEIATTFRSTSLIDILQLLASSFPAVETLTLDLTDHKDSYRIDDIADALHRFPCLRHLRLIQIFKRLESGRNEPWQSQRVLDPADEFKNKKILPANVETGLIWFTSRIAKRVRTLDAFYIDQRGFKHEQTGTGFGWLLSGWLQVIGGNRDVDGELKIAL